MCYVTPVTKWFGWQLLHQVHEISLDSVHKTRKGNVHKSTSVDCWPLFDYLMTHRKYIWNWQNPMVRQSKLTTDSHNLYIRLASWEGHVPVCVEVSHNAAPAETSLWTCHWHHQVFLSTLPLPTPQATGACLTSSLSSHHWLPFCTHSALLGSLLSFDLMQWKWRNISFQPFPCSYRWACAKSLHRFRALCSPVHWCPANVRCVESSLSQMDHVSAVKDSLSISLSIHV